MLGGQQRDHIDQRRFTTARFANNGYKFTAVDHQINTVECHDISGGTRVDFAYLAQLNEVSITVTIARTQRIGGEF